MADKKLHRGILGLLLVFVLIFTVCKNDGDDGGGGNTPTEELGADVTAKVVNEAANQAGLYFLATPNTAEYAVALQNAKNVGFTWSVDLAVQEESSSNFISGRANQLAASGSGFQFSLKTKSPPNGFRAAIGFNSAVFNFTADADNLGTETYNGLLAAIGDLEQLEGGWVMPESIVLTSLGIKVYTKYSGQDKDITDRISFDINMAQKDQGILLFSYGAVMVDRAITNFENEGYPLLVSDEEELIWSDGTPDNIITAEWWIGRQQP